MLKIKEIRELRNMTQQELATKTGISKRMISAYEANDNDITMSKLQNIATILEVSLLDLISDDNPVSPKHTTQNAPQDNCTNPSCLAKIDRLEKMIDDLLDDKRRLKQEMEYLQKGGAPPGKRVAGDMGESSKRKAV